MFRAARALLVVVGLILATQCTHQSPRPEESLPPLRVDPFAGLEPLGQDQAQPFTFRKGPAPPPSISERVKLPFPPPSAPGKVKRPSAAELRVVRTQPSGTDGLVGAVTASFNQPMVPVAALEEIRAAGAPLQLTPRVDGRFRWLGTETVTFEPKGRLPFGTHYVARIPAGTRAMSGQALENEVRWEFSTPRPDLVNALPRRHSDQNKPDTAIALLFNQRVDGAQVLPQLSVTDVPSGELQLVPKEEWPRLKYLGETVATWDADRTVVVRPKRPLPLARAITVRISAGLRGEGPLVSQRDLQHYFSIYGPLRVERISCADSEHCNPDAGLEVRFTNPLITTDLAPYIKVDPSPADLEVEGAGAQYTLRGSFAPRARLKVTVEPGPKDIHDQELAAKATGEVTTGDLYPQLSFPARGHVVMELKGDRRVPLEVTSVTQARLRLVRVQRDQIHDVIRLAQYTNDDEGRRDPLRGIKGLVSTRTLRTGVPQNGRARLGLSTDEGLGRNGAGVLYLELHAPELQRQDKWENPYRGLVVSVTDIGLMARYDHDQILVLATSLESGAPLAGAKLELRGGEAKVLWRGETDREGLAKLPGRRSLDGKPPFVLWAEKGRDTEFLALDASSADGTYLSSYYAWGYAPAKSHLRMFLFTDRNPYRPGETVHLKGVLRQENSTPLGGVEPIASSVTSVKIQVQSPRGTKILERESLELSPSKAFAIDVPVPVGGDLGAYSVYVNSSDGSAYGSFQVEEYRAPEFEVKAESGEGPFFFGDTLKARVGADYLFGAPMAGAELRWTLRREEASYRPPKNDGFTFGEEVPSWWRWRFNHGIRGGRYGGYAASTGAAGTIVKEGRGVLDASGRLELAQRLERDEKDRRYGPAAFTLEAEVQDQNRQTVANRKVVTVHPADLYIGLRPEKSIVRAGEPLRVSSVLAHLDGSRVAGTALRLRALEVQTKATPIKGPEGWSYKWESRETEVGSCGVQTAIDPSTCELTLKRPGMYLVRAETKDGVGRLARTTLTVYAFGPGYVPWRLENQSQIELVPDKDRYAPGETAHVLVKVPFASSRGLVTLSRSGMALHRVMEMKGNAQVIDVPIEDQFLPELWVGVALARGRVKDARGAAAQDLGRPTFAHGLVKLPVSVEEKRVRVSVKPAKDAVRPSGTLDVTISTTDSRGEAVSGELAVMVVDEGVLALLNYETPDPLSFFWSTRQPETALKDSRGALLKRETGLKRAAAAMNRPRYRNGGGLGLLARQSPIMAPTAGAVPEAAPAPMKSAVMKDEEGRTGKRAAAPGQKIRSRALFATTAYYNPSVVTDQAGHATLRIKMPDNLTTFRIMAVAVDRGRVDRFGRGEAQVKVRQPLLLRPSLPRFLSVGDAFEAAVMVHNETDRDGEVDVLVRGRNIVGQGAQRKRVTIRAHRAAEVRFTMSPVSAGPARLQFAAVLGEETDAVEKQLPVLLPATTEAFATYGMTEASVSQSVIPPKNALAGYGGLEISMSSTALTGLEDAVRFLVDYPYECTEQTASRILPIFSLKDILKDFGIGKLADLSLQRQLAEEGVRKLLSYQRWDGGFGMWPDARVSWPYLTAYAMFTLNRAREAGYKVPERTLPQGERFLKQILDHPRSTFGEEYDYVTQVISVWALSEQKQHQREHLKRLYGLRKRLPLFAKVWLLQSFYRADGVTPEVKELLRELQNAAAESASSAHFAEIRTESLRLLMHSEERTDAIALLALLEVDPTNSLLPKLARGLIQSRVKGSWSTTQSNAYALTALARYYRQIEKTVPDYVANLWLGEEGYLGQAAFKGRQLRVALQNVPLDVLQSSGQQDLILAKDGPGQLYYRVGLRYAPADLRLPPEEQGFAVTRVYEPLEKDPGSVKRDADGTWKIKAGSYVRVRLTVVVPDRRYYVAVVDPLPAGLEAVNLSLATSASSRLGNELQHRVYDTHSWYSLFAFDHHELRDESVVLFADRLPAGVYEHTYLARATSLGRFIAAPTKAEEMYRPETFGRTGSAWVEVR